MTRNLLCAAFALLLFAGAACTGATAQSLVLVGGSVYASPDAAPLPDAVLVTSNGVITAIGSRSDVKIPADARTIDCTGKTVVAGFWNSHVHLISPTMSKPPAENGPALEAELCQHVGHVKLHGVGADAQALGDVAIGEAVAHELHHAPLGGGEDIVMRWPAPFHGPSLSLRETEFPYPL